MTDAGFCNLHRVASFNKFLDASVSVVMDVRISLNVIAQPCVGDRTKGWAADMLDLSTPYEGYTVREYDETLNW